MGFRDDKLCRVIALRDYDVGFRILGLGLVVCGSGFSIQVLQCVCV